MKILSQSHIDEEGADILRTLLFQIKSMDANLNRFNFIDSLKKLFKKLLVLRNHVTFVDHMKILSQSHIDESCWYSQRPLPLPN